MKIINRISTIVLGACIAVISLSSCNDSKSYAERLVDETKAVNYYLSDFRVENSIPENNEFELGPDAPFYRLDDEGNVYMQVIRKGDFENNKATDDQMIYFRWERNNLLYYYNYGKMISEGNSNNMSYNSTWFRFNNTTNSSSTQWGSGVQMPLNYLGIDCEVNLIVKSQYGFSSETSNVTPYVYNIRYFVPMSN